MAVVADMPRACCEYGVGDFRRGLDGDKNREFVVVADGCGDVIAKRMAVLYSDYFRKPVIYAPLDGVQRGVNAENGYACC